MADFIPTQSPLTETRDFPVETEDLGLSQINPFPQQQSPHFNLDNDFYGLSAASNKKQLFIQPNDSISTRELSEAKTPELAASKTASSATGNAKFELNNLHSTIDAILRRSQVMYTKASVAHVVTPTKPATITSQNFTPIRPSSSYITSTTRNSSLNPYSKPNFFDSSNPYSKPVSLPTPTPTPTSHQKVKSATANDLANLIQSYRVHSVRPTTESTTVYHVEDIKSHRPTGFSSSAANFYPSSSHHQETITVPIGYDKAKLDQILSKIASSNSSQYAQPQLKNFSNSSTNFYTVSTRHWDVPNQLSLNKEYIRESYQQKQSVNANLLVQSPLEQRFNQPLPQQQQPKRSAPAPARYDKSSYVGEVQNDDDSELPEDSMFEERTREQAPLVVETKPQIQKFYDEPAKPKKLTKRQEILNEKRSSKQSVRRPAEEQQSSSKPNSRLQSPNPREYPPKNLFVYSPSKNNRNDLFVVSPGKPERNNFLVSPGRPEKSNLLASPSRVSTTHNKNFGNQRATGGSDISSRFNYAK